jgi:protein-S-isoprenylcysteine O-methyltransferase Ste14
MNKIFHFIQKQFDGLIYFFIGPFAILYIFPEFFLALEDKLDLDLKKYALLNHAGRLFTGAGAFLAIWCAALMYLNKKGSPNPFAMPKKVVTRGPYSLVRHPMMWSLHLVLIGEILNQSSPLLLAWFLIWLRFAALYIANYEEPFLNNLFGEEYRAYCAKTPRWFPLWYRENKMDDRSSIRA